MKSKMQRLGLTMLKLNSNIVGLETSLESNFGLDGSEFGWQCIPDRWSSKRKRPFSKEINNK